MSIGSWTQRDQFLEILGVVGINWWNRLVEMLLRLCQWPSFSLQMQMYWLQILHRTVAWPRIRHYLASHESGMDCNKTDPKLDPLDSLDSYSSDLVKVEEVPGGVKWAEQKGSRRH